MLKTKFSFFNLDYLLILIGISGYLPLLRSYFVLDEWHTFLFYWELSKNNYLQVLHYFLIPQAGQYLPITQILAYSIFLFSKINYLPYFLIGMSLHVIAALLLFGLIKNITSNKKIGILSSLFFIFSPQHFQGTSWVIANIGYSLSAIFFILSLIFFFKWIKKTTPNSFYQALFSSILIVLSLLTKDITLFAIVALPILAFVWTRNIRKVLASFFIVLPGLFLVIWKYSTIKSHPQSDFTISSHPGILNLITLPMRSLVESLVPQNIIYLLSKFFLLLFPPFTFSKLQTTWFNQKVESVGAEFVVIIFTLFIIYMGRKIYQKNKEAFKYFLTGIVIASFSGLSFFFVDSKQFSLLEPRYTYIGVIGMSISIASVMLIKWKHQKQLITLFFIYLLFLFVSTWKMSSGVANVNIQRLKILKSVSAGVPFGLDRMVLYIESDRSYYGLPDTVRTVPFEASPAIVFAAYLHDKAYIPQEVAGYDTFQRFDSQGYIFDENGGYGYFRNYDDLVKDVKKYSLNLNDIYSFKYDSKTNIVVNQTEEIRIKLSKTI